MSFNWPDVWENFSGVEFWRTVSKVLKRKEENPRLEFTSLAKREIEQFHVVVVKCKVFFFLIKPIAFFANLVALVVSLAPYYQAGD